MQHSENQIITQSKSWIEQFVIKHNLCPFSDYGFYNNLIEYTYFDKKEQSAVLNAFWKLLQKMEQNFKISNAFLILNATITFEELLDISSIIEVFLEEMEETSFQIVDFHPDLVFGDVDANDSSNFINRSPFPMFHILRVDEVERAIDSYQGDIEEVPFENIDKMKKIGVDSLSENLKKFRK